MLWLGCGGSIRENPVPNLDCDSAQATGEVRLTPNFANHLVMLFKYGLHQKSHIPGLLLSQPPLEFSWHLVSAVLHKKFHQLKAFKACPATLTVRSRDRMAMTAAF